jgi:hypothetical protein
MLEKIEESADLLIVLKDAVEFYLGHLKSQVDGYKQKISNLPERHKELEALLDQGNRVGLEIQALQEQKGVIEVELVPLKYELEVVGKVEMLEHEVRKREERIRKKEATVREELVGLDKQGGAFKGERAKSIAASWEYEKLLLELEIGRLVVDHDYQLRRLRELKIDREQTKNKERDIRGRVDKLAALVEQKRTIFDSVGKLISQQEAAIGDARPIDTRLKKSECDLEYLKVVVTIINGVSLNAGALLERATESVGVK